MNWKLIVQLSLFGLAMAIATVFWIPSNIEPAFWLVIFVVCSYTIAKQQQAKHFLHGLLVGIVNSVWVTTAHIVFFDNYIATHPKEASMMSSMPLPDSPRLMMACTGPVIGVVAGVVLGLFAFVASKFVKSRSAQ